MTRSKASSELSKVLWLKLVGVLVAPLCLINLAVAFFGNATVFPLSPFFLGPKLRALGTYALHRPKCLFVGHPEPGPVIEEAERRHRIPAGLLRILIDVESSSRPHRISSAGAMGLAQLQPGTAALLHVSDPFDTVQGIDGSARYLAEQLARFRSIRLAVAAYNAGPGSVNGRVPVNGETEFYVAKVVGQYERGLAEEAQAAAARHEEARVAALRAGPRPARRARPRSVP